MTRLLRTLLVIMSLSSPALAQDNSAQYDQNGADRIIFGVGTYNVTDDQANQRESMIRAEWRMASVPVWKTHPWLGLEYSTEGASFLGAGLESDIDLYEDWLILTLQTGVGYFDDGDERDPTLQYNPESGLQFRHQIELAVEFPAGNRVGIGFSHMSNAGLSDDGNPSMNALSFNVHIPMNFSAGRTSAPVQ